MGHSGPLKKLWTNLCYWGLSWRLWAIFVHLGHFGHLWKFCPFEPVFAGSDFSGPFVPLCVIYAIWVTLGHPVQVGLFGPLWTVLGHPGVIWAVWATLSTFGRHFTIWATLRPWCRLNMNRNKSKQISKSLQIICAKIVLGERM